MFLKTHTADLNSLLYLKDSPIVIIEYVPHGDLLGYLSRGVLDNYWLPESWGTRRPSNQTRHDPDINAADAVCLANCRWDALLIYNEGIAAI